MLFYSWQTRYSRLRTYFCALVLFRSRSIAGRGAFKRKKSGYNLAGMHISRTRFVILFIISGFAFLFITSSLLGTTGVRGFPKYPDPIIRTGGDSPIAWKRTVSTIILPIKIVLIGPLALPSVNFLKDDPPPPFIGIYLIFYWTLLASIIHYVLSKIKRAPLIGN